MEHTKEPWPAYPSITKADPVGLITLSMVDYDRARACVNACAGMPQDDLEELAKVEGGVMSLTVYADDMRQRVEKLEADYAAQGLALKAAKAMQAGETDRADRAERALLRAGWTYTEGAAEWKPPLWPSSSTLIEKFDNLQVVLVGLVDDIQGLMEESDGVSGLHRNGDIAPWSELEAGGRYERLSHLPDAISAIAAAKEGGTA
ncbi:hypothetical protein [Chromobacterium haemolyticum]|uniref:Uncharacterized protein n=1 Tax=Chromobacterium haemolyticum TaxID=394935 RepID=A0A1W0D5J6_9NEIS|nr:hypothetical protein [Chromobacterium haemolyticum]OQS42297.1 hypothetical protein B0T45_05760 [Chromobacterium haemolyticum]